jgi:hypothetical protein
MVIEASILNREIGMCELQGFLQCPDVIKHTRIALLFILYVPEIKPCMWITSGWSFDHGMAGLDMSWITLHDIAWDYSS